MPSITASFGELEHAVRTGRPAFDRVDDEGLFPYLRRHPDEAAIFDAAMTAKAAGDTAAVVGTYDFSRFSTIADVGGGRGHLLRAVLATAPDATGILFDLPEVIDAVDVDVDRLSVHPGDFFTDPLPAADAYVLMEVIHDWDDARAEAILTAVHKAAPSEATLLIVEAVADDSTTNPVVQTLDVIMLAITGGRERTATDFATLLQRAGFRMTEVFETPGPLRIVEARPG